MRSKLHTLVMRLPDLVAHERRESLVQLERLVEQRKLGEIAGETELAGRELVLFVEVSAASEDLIKSEVMPRLIALASELGLSDEATVEWAHQAGVPARDEPED